MVNMNNSKKCKGINKAKGIDGCGKESAYRKFGLCPSCLMEWATTNDNGKVWYKTQFLPKVKAKTIERKKTQNKAIREGLKSISRLIQEARIPFQKWIRQRDAHLPCISCGTSTTDEWQGGHYYKAEIYTGLIFEPINVNKQCKKCNTYLGGNESGYRLGLIQKYGQETVNELDRMANEKRQYKYTRDEILEIKKKYQLKLKQ